jgi:S-DNA-T family DNA segregation ATPase FtsK/SpoIIIE
MATAVRKKQTSNTSNSHVNEILAVIIAAVAVLIFLCLVSYSPSDWSLNSTGIDPQKRQNWIGLFGAVTADLLFQIVGLTAYFLPALLFLIAWRLFRLKTWRFSFSQTIGYFLFVAAFSSLIALFGFQGGIIGVFFEQIFFSLLGKIGTAILLSAFLITSVLLITSLSLSSIFESFKFAFENFGIHFNEWLVKRSADRAERQNETTVKAEKRHETIEEKQEKAVPTISIGDVIPVAETKSVKVRESVAEVFEELKQSPENEENTDFIEEDEILEIPEEVSAPTISTSDRTLEIPGEQTHSLADLNEALNEEISITPVQHTGDLNGNPSEEIEEESVPEEPRKPQNFDNYVLPPSEFLIPPEPRIEQKDEELLAIAHELTDKTKEFNVTGRVMHICQGPVVTTYEFKPDPGVKYSRVTGLSDDLCLALKAESIRIDRIPGKAFVGIEVPNRERETIQLREVIESKKFKEAESLLSIALGKRIDGRNYVADLAKMPHLLIAGATGAGKSVGVNTLIVSILYKAKPDEVKFIMVDPKRLELGVYADIPHLATPIITDPKRAAIALKWAVSEMEKRYKDLAGWGVRNIDGYNTEVKRRNSLEQYDDNGEQHHTLPYIVIIIDELADLMMVSGKEVEESITRLAQMARAVGIHLVLATQRPSVDVITGLIKANFPSRISFRVSSKVDSRTIIDANGAETLLGRGDMLFLPPATSQIVRVHGAFVDEKEIHRVVEHIKAQGNPEYDTTITKTEEELDDSGDLPGRKDPLFWDAVRSVVSAKRASTSLLQRHLRIGYGRAAAILDAMVREGYIGEMDGSTRARPILQKAYDDLQDMDEMND